MKTISTDEKTGMQALERKAPDLPMQVGQCRKQEYEYTRHGTYCLTANWDVVEGKVISPTIGDTRNEIDFQQHLEQTVNNDPSVKKWCFIVDNLNTHKSELLVYWASELAGTPEEELGKKREERYPQRHEHQSGLFGRPTASRLFYLHAQTLLLAQPN